MFQAGDPRESKGLVLGQKGLWLLKLNSASYGSLFTGRGSQDRCLLSGCGPASVIWTASSAFLCCPCDVWLGHEPALRSSSDQGKGVTNSCHGHCILWLFEPLPFLCCLSALRALVSPDPPAAHPGLGHQQSGLH